MQAMPSSWRDKPRSLLVTSFEAATRVHSGVSLLDLFQLLELWISWTDLTKAVRACIGLHYIPGGSARARPLAGWELGTVLILRSVADVIGGTQLIDALDALEGPQRTQYRALARGFGVCFLSRDTPVPALEDTCTYCGGLRYMRSACLSCGLPHNVEVSTPINSSLPHKGHFSRADDTILEHARLNAIAAGIAYIDKCGHEHNTFKEFGGDIIFLFRNLVHSAGLNGQISEVASQPSRRDEVRMSLQAACSFARLIQRWTTEHVRMNNEIEMEEILNIVEALHTLAQLGIESDDSLPLAKEISTMLTTVEHPICVN
jgi:hypothetical protein